MAVVVVGLAMMVLAVAVAEALAVAAKGIAFQVDTMMCDIKMAGQVAIMTSGLSRGIQSKDPITGHSKPTSFLSCCNGLLARRC